MELRLKDTKSIARRVNQGRILKLLRSEGPLSRAELARRLGLTKATVSRIIADLEAYNIVRPVGIVATQTSGRNPLLYEFNHNFAHVLGLEVRQLSLRGVVTNLEASPLHRTTLPLSDSRVETVIDGLHTLLRHVHAELDTPKLVGIGVGIPGICDMDSGKVILAENLDWSDVPLLSLLEERFHIPIYIVNRANAAALGEKWYGGGKDVDSLVYVHVGSGIGAGIVQGGELVQGAKGAAGEIGHITIIPGGPLCRCGKRGCLEALASTTAIVERMRVLTRVKRDTDFMNLIGVPLEEMTPLHIAGAADAGHSLAIEVLQEAAEYIGIGIATVISLFNPQKVVVGGFAGYAPAFFIEAIRKSALHHTMDILRDAVHIVPSALGEDAVPIGAAALFISRYLYFESSMPFV